MVVELILASVNKARTQLLHNHERNTLHEIDKYFVNGLLKVNISCKS
jgi:hypothetical protein